VEVHGEQPALTLARLVLERPRALSRDELAELLWPDGPPDAWEGPARQVLSRARRALARAEIDASALRSEGGRITLTPSEPISTDVEDALDAVAAAAEAVDRERFDEAFAVARAARIAFRLPFFPDAEGRWVAHWHQRLHDAHARALHLAAEAALSTGDTAAAIEAGEAAIALDPYDEVATRSVMAAHDVRGSRALALAAYERCRRLLDEELGVRPSEETEAAQLMLLGRAPEPPARSARDGARDPIVPLPFVGRREELDELTRRWRALDRSGGTVALISGEPGIGKTRLAHELASVAAGDGSLVLWGQCVADVSLPFDPFGAILGQLVEQRPAVLEALGTMRGDLAHLVPALGRRSRRGAADDGQAQARIFRAASAALDVVADERLLLVIDDAQWARGDALALARHLAPSMADRPWLACVTFRYAQGPVAATLADLTHGVSVVDLGLRGLDESALTEMLDLIGVAGPDRTEALAADVVRRTAGNPFFVSQLVEDAARHGGLDVEGVPGAVSRHVVRRVDALDESHAALLSLTAIVGGEVDLAILEACAVHPEPVLDRLERLTRERFLEEIDAERFGFRHSIVRDAVLGTVGPTRRRRLHGRVADALAATGAEPSLIAHHYLSAGPSRADDATRWLLSVGDDALRAGAWAVAAEQFANAVGCASDVDSRIAARVGLGRAQRARGEPVVSRATLEAALAEARTNGRGAGAARAILALVGGGGRGVAVDLPDEARTVLWREAVAGLAEDDPLLVPILGELALSLVLTDAVEERESLCARCVAAARAIGEPALVASALQTRRVSLMGPWGTEQRLRDGEAVLGFGSHTIGPEPHLAALLGRVEDELELGNRAAVDAALIEATEIAGVLAHPYWSWATTSWRSVLAIAAGRYADAEALAREAFASQAPAHHPEALAALGVNLVTIRMLEGRAGEVLDLLDEAATDNPQIPAYRAVLALASLLADDRVRAERAYTSFAACDFDVPPDSNWLVTHAALAEVAAATGDLRGVAVLTDRLTPYAERHVVLNCYGGGGSYWGPVAHGLGLLALAAGEHEAAATWAGQARRAQRALGAESFRDRVEDLVHAAQPTVTRRGAVTRG